ncbi:unnamed protein product [Vitrella brassicaformis CCMP3155]|uniref:Uncharacterized protein n=2 Tax=Vitrella brassicaformis TaxID=1169539 RepID=A0A0G4EW28_VITBC|nr:unnamed protein product [Vitrella brassicaformis CCMP3155]|eukprot:CEM02540.1 unnamed protein product [Vitrella brassicaformis CCMP3155]
MGEKEYSKDELEAIVKRLAAVSMDANDYSKSFSGSKEMAAAEKEFATLVKDDKNEASMGGVSEKSLTTGKWYRFLNAQGTCYLYIHNITKEITAIRPENYVDEPNTTQQGGDDDVNKTKEPTIQLRQLEAELERCKNAQKIPLLLCNEETHDNVVTFFKYKGFVLDCRPLALGGIKTGTKVEEALEKGRKTIVAALKNGGRLLVDIAFDCPDFKTKICTMKNKEFFPHQVFSFGKLASTKIVYEKLYRDEDKESGQCAARDGFEVALVAVSPPLTIEALTERIPGISLMEVIRVTS